MRNKTAKLKAKSDHKKATRWCAAQITHHLAPERCINAHIHGNAIFCNFSASVVRRCPFDGASLSQRICQAQERVFKAMAECGASACCSAPRNRPCRVHFIKRRRNWPAKSGCSGFFEKANRIADRDDRLCRIVRYLDAELLLESHDEFDRIERIGSEILDEIGIVDDFVGINAEMLNDNFLHALGDIAHDRLILVPISC
jgi:hypothetical protein